jgi:hypothetical protein
VHALVALAAGVKATLYAQLLFAASEVAQEEFEIVKSVVLPLVKLALMPVIALLELLLSSKASVGLVPPMT